MGGDKQICNFACDVLQYRRKKRSTVSAEKTVIILDKNVVERLGIS